MKKLLPAIVAIFSFMQVAVLNCEAGCLSGSHNHSEKMSSDHSCCKGKKSVGKSCDPEFESNSQYNCFHELVGSVTVIESSKSVTISERFSSKAKFINIEHKRSNLLSNALALEHDPERNFLKFKSSYNKVYIRQRKILI